MYSISQTKAVGSVRVTGHSLVELESYPNYLYYNCILTEPAFLVLHISSSSISLSLDVHMLCSPLICIHLMMLSLSFSAWLFLYVCKLINPVLAFWSRISWMISRCVTFQWKKKTLAFYLHWLYLVWPLNPWWSSWICIPSSCHTL